MTGSILTIGHSNHSLEAFLALLGEHGVGAVADVRSMPYSRFNPQFNRETLSISLTDAGLAYVYLGRELGGRSGDRRCYENGRIRYDRVAASASFQDGLRRLHNGMMGEHCIALMCSEGEPLSCHRTLLVAHALDAAGTATAHILPNGEIETHDAAMDRLLRLLDIAEDDLFSPRQALVELAIAEQAKRVGHAIAPDATVDDGGGNPV